ncbi:MAG: M36 family metallopeptidase [Flavobacterium sp. JAD_PAG50586_2]|nr:MAG: M36 family metallopeptidase [Flavobacterium sp. JAD_PAG50586_2]
MTAGNNVYAFEDTTDSDFGESPDGGESLAFDFPYSGINDDAFNSVNAATTNLFYMNNSIHDIFFHYGFDEENGNFQLNNYSGLGDGFDGVVAQSQDGGGINNANFYTPTDGESGFMQMYLWNRKPVGNLITVTSPPSFAGNYQAYESTSIPNTLRLPIAPSFVSGELIKVIDDTDDTTDGCGTILNAGQVNGNIAMIKRGSCSTNEKMFAAESAGAVAVIVYTDLPGNFVVGGFVEDDITIPVISVKKEVADLLLNQMVSGPVEVNLSSPVSDFVNVDGDFDNLIITHEYGHGISNRLTGGRFNTDCLDNNEQMGEGWSDWFGLMLQLKAGDNGAQRRGVGTFAINQPTNDVGIRSYPYSTDMTVNPFTFADTNTLIRPHGTGSVWATMLWDLTWAYINKYGFNPNIYSGNGGNNKVMQLVIDALKLQPCLPSFVEGRDAIIAADQAITGGQDFCMIWEVFARRGLGLSASSGDGDSTTDQIEGFDVPAPGPVCTLGIDYNMNDDLISVYPNPSSGNFNIRINAFSGKINYQLFDLNGRIIIEKFNVDCNNEAQVNLVGVQTGIYLIKINADNLSTTKKIMVK